MFSPPENWKTLLFIFCSVFLSSECSILNDSKSTIICLAGDTLYNVTLVGGINAGVFTSIPTANTMAQCVRESCNRKVGQVAFLLEDTCFMLSCYKDELCQTTPNKTSTLRVAITRYSFFDAAPIFKQLPRILHIIENNRVGVNLLDIFASAKSRRSDNAAVYFNITRGNVGNAFKLIQRSQQKGASLVANVVIDRERISNYNLVIQATNVDEQKVSNAVLRVEVLDSNDNPPKFSRPEYNTSIYSNISVGAEVFRVNAVDADTSENAQIKYSLGNYTELFKINPDTGTILLKQKFRLDQTRTFSLLVAAIDGRHQTVVSVHVKVLAFNYFRPYFQHLNYQLRVSEAVQIGTSLVRISATDSDTGSFGNLQYSILSGDRTFFNIGDNGDVTTRKHLFQIEVKNFTLRVGVRDRGNPPLEALHTVKLEILVIPLVRHKVQFDLPHYTVHITENIPVGSVILKVRAVAGLSSKIPQKERSPGDREQNQRIIYKIENKDGAQFFHISKFTGVISTKRAIDYEKNKEFKLTVIAKDDEARKRVLHVQEDHTIVTIKVLNDNCSQFVLSSYKKVISENLTVNSSILQVTANYPIACMSNNLEYVILNGNTNDTFSLDSNTGILRLSKSLLKGSIGFYNLTVYARDKGRSRTTSRSTSIFLKVKRHDYSPTRKPTNTVPFYFVTVNESCPLYTEILRVRTRMSPGNETWIRYYFSEITDGDAQHFAINTRTGAIILLRKLNYKKKKIYAFLVGAVDVMTASSFESMLVRVKVKDVNDHKPYFVKTIYNVLYKREPLLLSNVTRIEAKDDDAHKNAELTYFIHGNTRNKTTYFEIDSKTGIIKIKRKLQHQSLSLFRMSVSVIDNGTPVLEADKKAQVNVLIFQPFATPLTLLDTTESTITAQFDLKCLDLSNVDQFWVIIQEYMPSERQFQEYSKMKPLNWFQVHFLQKDNQRLRRYISKIVSNTYDITKFGMFRIILGDGTDCNAKNKTAICNGPLNPGSSYRFQLRVFIKDSGPFSQYKYKDGNFTEHLSTGVIKPAKIYKTSERNSDRPDDYGAVVQSVGAALVFVLLLIVIRFSYIN